MRPAFSLPASLLGGFNVGFWYFHGSTTPLQPAFGSDDPRETSGDQHQVASAADSTDLKTERFLLAALAKGKGLDRDSELRPAIMLLWKSDER